MSTSNSLKEMFNTKTNENNFHLHFLVNVFREKKKRPIIVNLIALKSRLLFGLIASLKEINYLFGLK